MEGSRLGPYQLLTELGSGGMGKVYRAEVAGPVPGLDTGRAVALKVIHTHLLEAPGFFKRFLREADIGRTIEHENVVRTFDCDALLHEGVQQNFLVMEYVEGQTLRDLLQELERVPEELCRHIGREVAKGLAAIHEAGVVHRDLKPENVLITPEHVVKVMDLGVARLQEEAIRLSQAGAFVGSLEYAAPEQFRSADGEPDGRADLHALGVVLYELATGQHPYCDEDASRLIRNILDEQPRKAGEVNPQLSPFFEEVVHTLIAKDREQRFGAATDLAQTLEEGEKSEWWKQRAKAHRLETKRPLRRIRIPRETALYGRDDDLAKLRTLFDKAKAGDGQVLLIEGEAGIGKTRIVDEFVGRLRQEGEDINFLFGSYPPGGAATAAGAFSEAYREQFGAEGLENTLEDYITPTPILIPAFAAILKGEMTPKDAESLTKDSLQTVFVHATRGLAAERTTVVLIDDLHFAPEDGRALFSSLAMAAPGHHILLLGTMRPGVSEDWIANVERLDHAWRMVLARLGPKDLSALLKDAFRSERLAHELGMKIAEKSDGNPFFAFEIIRGLREGQFISPKPDGTWVTTKVIQEIQVPSSVLDLVSARIADLSQEERDLVDVASCCGFSFDAAMLADVVGTGRIPVLKTLSQIERAHRLVRSSGREFVFDHHQVQEAVYGSLPEMLREEYHAAIAEALEARSGAANRAPEDLDGALAVDLCEHYLKGKQGKRAVRYLDAALDHLEAGYLNSQAISLMDRAMGVPHLLREDGRLAVLLRKNVLLDLLGQREAQDEVLAEAHALADEAEDQTALMKLERALGWAFLRTDHYEEAEAHFERSFAIAREIDDRQGEADAMMGLANVAWHLSRYEEARECYERCLAIARGIGDRRGEVHAAVGVGLVCGALGRHEEAKECFEQAVFIAREVGDRRAEVNAMGGLGNTCKVLGRLEEAKAHHECGRAVAREIGDRRGEAVVTGNLGVANYVLGRHEEAKECFEQAMSIAREIGSRRQEAYARGNLASLEMDRGHLSRPLARRRANLAYFQEVGDRASMSISLGNIGVCLRRLGRWTEAHEHLDRSLRVAREIGARSLEAVALQTLALLWFDLGQMDRACKALGSSLTICHEVGARDDEGHVLSALGALAQEEGDGTKALEFTGRALTLCREIGDEGGIASSLCQQGEIQWRSGRADEAREALDEAVRLLRGQHVEPELARALALLASLPGGDPGTAETALRESGEAGSTPETRYYLWKATSKDEHLAEAKRLLDYRVEHAPEEYRESMLKNVRLHREIMEAWTEHGETAGSGESAT